MALELSPDIQRLLGLDITNPAAAGMPALQSGGNEAIAEFLRSRRQFSPEETFAAITNFLMQMGDRRRNSAGYRMAPKESDQLAEENKAWDLKFRTNDERIARERSRMPAGDTRMTFTEQQSLTPQQRINQRFGLTDDMTPAERRARITGKTPTQPDVPAQVKQNAIRNALRASGAITAPTGPGMAYDDASGQMIPIGVATQKLANRNAEQARLAQAQQLAKWREQNPALAQAIRNDVLSMF